MTSGEGLIPASSFLWVSPAALYFSSSKSGCVVFVFIVVVWLGLVLSSLYYVESWPLYPSSLQVFYNEGVLDLSELFYL